MIEQPNPLSLTRQYELLGLSRAALYYRPVEVSIDELELGAYRPSVSPHAILWLAANDGLASNTGPHG